MCVYMYAYTHNHISQMYLCNGHMSEHLDFIQVLLQFNGQINLDKTL